MVVSWKTPLKGLFIFKAYLFLNTIEIAPYLKLLHWGHLPNIMTSQLPEVKVKVGANTRLTRSSS